MNPALNPYAPGAGRPPAALVGRNAEQVAWRVGLERIQAGRTTQPEVLFGLRGVGKTVLLADLAAEARARNWIVARIEAGAGKSLRESLGEALHGPLADLARPSAGLLLRRALKTLGSFKASYDSNGAWSFGLDLTDAGGGGAGTGVLETDVAKLVRDLSRAAEEEHVGLAILVDEAQELSSEELATVCTVAQSVGIDGLAAQFALAGLPSLPRELAEARSYAERLFRYDEVGALDDGVARAALLQPASYERVSWNDDALDYAVSQAGGYPYFLQQFGQEVWNEAGGSPITLVDARVGVTRARAELDRGFFRSRWDRATRAEREYLLAMALDGDSGSSSGTVAHRLGRSNSSLGPARAKLIAKGIVYSPEHGVVAFTVPGMADFVRRQTEG